MKTITTISLLYFALTSAFAQEPATIQERIGEWETALSDFKGAFNGPVITELPSDLPMMKATIGTDKIAPINLLAFYTGFDAMQMGHLDYVRRPLMAPGIVESTISGSLALWLAEENTATIHRLGSTGVEFHELSPKGQSALGKLARGLPGLMDAILSGQPVAVALSANPTAHFKGEKSYLSVGQYRYDREMKIVKEASTQTDDFKPERYEKSEKLEIRTLKGWVHEIKQSYSKTILYDARLDECLFAVFGELTPEELHAAITFVSTPQVTRTADWSRPNRSDITNPILDGIENKEDTYQELGDLKFSDFASERAMTLDQLSAQSDKMKEYRDMLKIPGSESVSLDLVLSLSIWAAGVGPIPGSTASICGKPARSITSNSMKFLITP